MLGLGQRVGDDLAVGAYRLGWGTVRRLPERTAHTVFERLADLTVARGGKGVQRLRSNYARVRPELSTSELDALVKAGMRSYLRYYCEAFRLPDRSPEEIVASVRVEGDGAVRAELDAGRPVVCFLGHLGNWDLAGAWGSRELGSVVTVAERLKPERVYAEFLAFRESLGMTILPLTGGGDVFAQLRGHLTRPVLMPLLADRDLTDRGIEVDLCGHRSKMAAGPAALSLATGAALHPVSIHYERVDERSWKHRTVITFHDRVVAPASGTTRHKAQALTQQCADALGAAIRQHTADWHMLQRVFLDDLAPRTDLAPRATGSVAVRIGIVCPYSFDVPGGVQFHVRDLAEHFLAQGHHVSVLAPADEDTPVPDYVESVGRAVPVRYNGSVARLNFGPVTAARVGRWIERGEFDVVHLHEPVTPSISVLALWAAEGPVVATFHTSNLRSRAMQAAYPLLRPSLEKINGRIAVSEDARRTVTTHLGGDAVVIPNGVNVSRFADATPKTAWIGTPEAPTLAFLGRIDEPRKGLPVLSEAMAAVLARFPGTRLLVAGPGDVGAARERLDPAVAAATEFLGTVSDEDKAALLASVDLYIAPHTGGESFGIVLVEAMSAGAPVVASNLPAFVRVLDGGLAGATFANEDAGDLAAQVVRLLTDPAARERLSEIGSRRALVFDWSVVAEDVMAVYDTVTHGVDAGRGEQSTDTRWTRLLRGRVRGGED